MESALTSIIIFTVGIFAAVTLTFTFLEIQSSLWSAEQVRQEERLERERTAIDITGAETQSNGSMIRVKVRNTGEIKLADFDRWDVIVEYYTDGLTEEDPNILQVAWVPFTDDNLEDLQWIVSGIYLNADTLEPEVFEPGILNPDEEMVLQAQVSPTVAMTTTNRITIGSINGIHASSHFIR